MNKIKLMLCVVLLTATLQSSFAQTEPVSAVITEAGDPAQAWKNFMTPNENHKMLAREEGTWEGEVSQWMDPSAPPTKAKATNVVTMTMDGLYQMGEFSCTMMGMAMKGKSTVGYDNAKKMFVSTWIDNMGSGIVKMTGTYDEKTKTVSMKGTQTDPMTGKDTEIREEILYHDEKSYTMTMYGVNMDGKEMKFMEGTFKKVK